MIEMNSKKVALFLFSAGLFLAYEKPSRANTSVEYPSVTTEFASGSDTFEDPATGMAADTIDLSKVPISEKQLGGFPVFNPPANMTTLNKPIIRDFDWLFFPTQQGLIRVKGKVYKTFLTTVSGKEWSLAYFEKSYKDLIIAAGGVMVFSGKVSAKELDRVKDEATYFGEEGSIDYPNDMVKVYAPWS